MEFKCDVCSLTVKTARHLKIHKNLEHSSDTSYNCKFCGKRYGSRGEVKRHELIHQEPKFQCTICAKRFIHKTNLTDHERSHSGEKQFNCTICGKSFGRLKNLQQHKSGVHKIVGPRGRKAGWSRKSKIFKGENDRI